MRLASFFSKLSWPILAPMAWGYGGVVWARNRCYDHGHMTARSVSAPVVSIGNIVAGGTGKTPLTQMLVEELLSAGRVAVLSRGYRSKAEHRLTPTWVSKGEGPLVSWQEGGDEALLLATKMPKALVVSGRSRWLSAQEAITEGARLIVLDDGMQHRALQRDLDVVVIDGHDPFGGRAYLPLGRLRDSPSQLRRASLIVVTRPTEERLLLERQLGAVTNAPIVWMRPALHSVVDLEGEKYEKIEGRKVGVFCGIAKPESFVQLVRRMGCHVVASRIVPDHRAISDEQIVALANKVRHRGGDLLLCTEKDSIKLHSGHCPSLPIGVVRRSFAITGNEEGWRTFVARCRSMMTS